jgi:hypothetical protein
MNFRIAASVLVSAAAFACIVTAHCAQAAIISVEPSVSGRPALVLVGGDLEPDDGDEFRSKTSFLSKAIVAFRSDGGSVVSGIQIGESIRLKGFTTAVIGTARCASACALAWLGGIRRLMSPEARIGFHAAYNLEGQETGVGNALIGAYLNKIGLPYAAVIYITKASPDSMTWLSVADAEKRGIDVEVSRPQRIQSATGVSPSRGLPVAPTRRKAQAPGEQCTFGVRNCTQLVAKLSAAEIQAIFFTGAEFTATTPSGIKFKMIYTGDGKALRVPTGNGGSWSEGSWKLDEAGYCMTWKGGKPICFTVVAVDKSKWSVMMGSSVIATWSK